MAKKTVVKDILGLLEPKAKVSICFFAYGIPTGLDTSKFSIETAEDCLNKLNPDSLRALVLHVNAQECTGGRININAELVH